MKSVYPILKLEESAWNKRIQAKLQNSPKNQKNHELQLAIQKHFTRVLAYKLYLVGLLLDKSAFC